MVMPAWLVKRRLAQNSARLRTLREELAQLDEQIDYVVSDADSDAVRALVAETPGATFAANDSRKHAEAMVRQRTHVVATIADLEARQDALLDRLSASS